MKGKADLDRLAQGQRQSFHLSQAVHNFSLANNLFEASKERQPTKKCFDWVITISFYSALHFLRCAIEVDRACLLYGIPLNDMNFDQIVSFRRGVAHQSKFPQNAVFSKHEILRKIAEESYPDIHADYEHLYNASTTARYKQYKGATLENGEAAGEKCQKVLAWFKVTYGNQFSEASFIDPLKECDLKFSCQEN